MALQSGIENLIINKTTTGVPTAGGALGPAYLGQVDASRVFQAYGTTSAGTGAATILVQVSTNNSDWITLGTITLTLGTSSTSDGFASSACWPYVRGNVSAISGTDGTVSLKMAWIR